MSSARPSLSFGGSVCSLDRPNQTSIRSFFATATQSNHRPGKQNRRLKRKGNPNQQTKASKKRVSMTPTLGQNGSNTQQQHRGTVNGKAPGKKKHQQLYLDLGQRNFAKQTECGVCGMLFVHGVSEDAKRHAAICRDYQQGVPFASLDNARVVQNIKLNQRKSAVPRTVTVVEVCLLLWRFLGTGLFVAKLNLYFRFCLFAVPKFSSPIFFQIRPNDCSALRKKVSQIKAIVDQELGFAEDSDGSSKKRTAFLAIADKRVIGMVLAEPIATAYLLLPQSPSTDTDKAISQTNLTASGLERSNIPVRAAVGIHQMWVHHKFRSLGIASTLVDAARSKMVFGYTIPVHELAFSSPTESGVRFAVRYTTTRHCQKSDTTGSTCKTAENKRPLFAGEVLVYDCC